MVTTVFELLATPRLQVLTVAFVPHLILAVLTLLVATSLIFVIMTGGIVLAIRRQSTLTTIITALLAILAFANVTAIATSQFIGIALIVAFCLTVSSWWLLHRCSATLIKMDVY